MSIHRNISVLSKDVWISIIDHLPFKSVLLLLETGDSRIQKLRRALMRLELNRTQVLSKPLSVSYLNSWNFIRKLVINTNGGINSPLCVPPSLCSLTIILHAKIDSNIELLESFHNFLSLPTYNENTVPMLTEFNIIRSYYSCPYQGDLTNIVGSIICRLPLTSLTCELDLCISVIFKLPSTLTIFRSNLYHTSNYPVPVLPPGLTSLHLNNRSDEWDLKLSGNYSGILSGLPSGLCTLSTPLYHLSDPNIVASLPRSLTSLTVQNCLNSDLLCLLPPTLKTLRQSNKGTFSKVNIHPSLLPRTLTRLNMYIFEDPMLWKHLPRGLTSVNTVHSILIDDHRRFPFLNDLPPALTGIQFQITPSHKIIRGKLQHTTLKSLIINDDQSYKSTKCSILKAFVPTSKNDAFVSLDTLSLDCRYLDIEVVPGIFLPSLTKLKLCAFSFINNDLQHLPMNSRLQSLELNTYSRFTPTLSKQTSFLLALPSTLQELTIHSHVFDTSKPCLGLLPDSLVVLDIKLSAKHFKFKSLSDVPRSLQVLRLHLSTEEKGLVMYSSLEDILTYLPRTLRIYRCSSVSSRDYPIHLILEDCVYTRSKARVEITDILISHMPPFLREFYSTLIGATTIDDELKILLERLQSST